jgi:hypothetical protein
VYLQMIFKSCRSKGNRWSSRGSLIFSDQSVFPITLGGEGEQERVITRDPLILWPVVTYRARRLVQEIVFRGEVHFTLIIEEP